MGRLMDAPPNGALAPRDPGPEPIGAIGAPRGVEQAGTGPSYAGNPWRGALAYTVLVILFGAVVRITGSGAGCGQHWPTCQGEVAHLPRTVETVIELTHRVTSGLSMLVVFGVAVYTLRRVPRGHIARSAALAACVLMIVEALIGAALVLLRYVGHNDSVGRAVIMAVHLVNTLGLTAAMAFSACSFSWKLERVEWRTREAAWLFLGALGIVVVSAAGAVTALGDTLYPLEGVGAANALEAAGDQSQHFLERLRGVHPVLAVVVSGFLLALGPRIAERAPSQAAALAEAWPTRIVALVVMQLALGVVNVWLSAPGWMQVVHLLAALLLWLAWVSLAFAVLGRAGQSSPNAS